MSQLDFALAIGLSSGQAISNIENGRSGKMNSKPFAATAKLMGLLPAELMAKTKEPSHNDTLIVPIALAALIRERAASEGMTIPDLLTTLLARRPGKKKGA